MILPPAIPVILFGAFDRHNFGDLLFPHIAAALLAPAHPVFAGLMESDLRSCGGHRVEPLANLAARWRDTPVHLVHAGGELLTCNAWQAAVMTLPPEEVPHSIARFDGYPREALEWAQRRMRIAALAPYTVRRSLFPHARTVIYNAVGGVDLDTWERDYRDEVIANLQAADAVGVRDARTQAHLRAAGIHSRLMPDPAVMVEELFGNRIRQRAGEEEVAHMRQAFPQGYVAVQFSADFGDEVTLQQLAVQLDALVQATGLGIVFFRAGAAPWHDDLACFEHVAKRMRARTNVFMSLDLWEICALIAASRAYAGSSLHGRIVAMAYALPRVNITLAGHGAKQAAYVEAWETAHMPGVLPVDSLAQGLQQALSAGTASLKELARHQAECYRRAIQALGSLLTA